MTTLTPLEPWIKSKTGLPATAPLTRPFLAEYQLRKVRETIAHARRHSPFYRQQLKGCGDPASLEELARFPFTFPADLQADDLRFLCVSRGEIERVVTLPSSGTTAPAKRLHFTAEDLELTVDFFQHGMATLVEPGRQGAHPHAGRASRQRRRPAGQGTAAYGCDGIVHGLVR